MCVIIYTVKNCDINRAVKNKTISVKQISNVDCYFRDAIGDEAHPNCKNRHVNGAQYLKCFCCEEDNRIEQCTGCKHV